MTSTSLETPEYKLTRFLIGLVFVSGMLIAVVGLMIVHELQHLSSQREAIQADWSDQQKELTRRMDDLSTKVQTLVHKTEKEQP